MSRILLLLPMLLVVASCGTESTPVNTTGIDQIRLNQIGYYPAATKRFVVTAATQSDAFRVVDASTGDAVYEGSLSPSRDWALSGESVRVGDFSPLRTHGAYRIVVEDNGASHPFEIGPNVLRAPFLGSIKGLYFQRVGQPLLEQHAGLYAREMGHPDLEVPFHPSLNRSGTRDAPGGWYDAGDFGKYVINGAYPLAQMAVLLEHYPDQVIDGDLSIPESGNGLNDLLDELKYEMDWLLTMQDEDGGLFHKMTSEVFEGMIMPEAATKQRYIYAKGTAATLDFAGAAAKFSRVISPVDPAYADQCLQAASRAWNWALQNPNVQFKNPEGVVTGQYGDDDFSQEFYWAAAELYVTTGQSSYLDHLKEIEVDFTFSAGESWANHLHYLGLFVLIDHQDQIPDELNQQLQNQLLAAADDLIQKAANNAYFQPLTDFHWGSSSDVMNAAYIVAQAYRLDPQPSYLAFVQDGANYILGLNAVGYSFLTGFGDRTPQFIHHRQSVADGIAEPVPGLLSGGPNSYQQDKHEAEYPAVTFPMTSWVDQEPSYASNEICLNWNAPLTYVLGFLEMESK